MIFFVIYRMQTMQFFGWQLIFSFNKNCELFFIRRFNICQKNCHIGNAKGNSMEKITKNVIEMSFSQFEISLSFDTSVASTNFSVSLPLKFYFKIHFRPHNVSFTFFCVLTIISMFDSVQDFEKKTILLTSNRRLFFSSLISLQPFAN